MTNRSALWFVKQTGSGLSLMRSFVALVLLLLAGSMPLPSPLLGQSGGGLRGYYGNANLQPTPGVYLGVQMIDIDANRAAQLKLPEERGVAVTGVASDSPAQAAGIRPGDALLTYNGENILGGQQLVRLVRETPPGRKVKVQLWRDGKAQTVTVAIAPLQIFQNDSASMPNVRVTDVTVPGAVASLGMPDVPLMVLVWRSSLLGIECEGLSAELGRYFGVKSGILVRSVLSGSPAETAGLRGGDVLVSIDNRPLISPRDLNAFHRSLRPDTKTLSLGVVRDKHSMTINAPVPPVQQPE